MQAIGFYLLLPFLYLISWLPFSVLYLLSDLLFVVVYYVLGYRKEVVTGNLKRSFPKKSDAEIAGLRIKFYRCFCDMLLEIHKTLTVSRSEMLKRCTVDEKTRVLMQRYYNQKKSVILVMGHQGNWEWGGNAFSLACPQPLYVIYHPLSNGYFNRLVIRMRTRFGTRLIEMKNTFRDMFALKNEVTATAFIADQSPPPESARWTTFLNQETGVYQGTEKIALKLNYPVVFMNVKRLKRGYYELSATVLCEEPFKTSEGEITELHTRELEKQILSQPETWLWSHRRWKHRRPD